MTRKLLLFFFAFEFFQLRRSEVASFFINFGLDVLENVESTKKCSDFFSKKKYPSWFSGVLYTT